MAVVVVVTAMLVVMVVVIVCIVMVVAMIVAMVMTRMVVRMTMCGVVMLIRRMRVTVAIIGATFGIERCLDLEHPRAQPLHHFLDHVIAPDA